MSKFINENLLCERTWSVNLLTLFHQIHMRRFHIRWNICRRIEISSLSHSLKYQYSYTRISWCSNHRDYCSQWILNIHENFKEFQAWRSSENSVWRLFLCFARTSFRSASIKEESNHEEIKSWYNNWVIAKIFRRKFKDSSPRRRSWWKIRRKDFLRSDRLRK